MTFNELKDFIFENCLSQMGFAKGYKTGWKDLGSSFWQKF